MFDTRYMEQITAVQVIFQEKFGTMSTLIERYKGRNFFHTQDREGFILWRAAKYISSGGESKIIKPCYDAITSGTEANARITNEKCKVVDYLRDAYGALNKYQKERVSRLAGSGDPFDATNAVIEFFKDLLEYLSTLDEKTLVTGLQQAQQFLNAILIHPGRGDGKGLFPTTDNFTTVNISTYTFRGALTATCDHLKMAEEHLDLLSKEVQIHALFEQVQEANKTLLKLMLRYSVVVMRDVHNQSWAEIITVNGVRDLNKKDNEQFIRTDSGQLAHLTALCPAHRYNFAPDSAGIKTCIDAPQDTRVLSNYLEASLLECGFVKIRRAVNQDERHQDKGFEIYFDDEPDCFSVFFEGNEYKLNLMNGNSGIFKIFARDRELQKLNRLLYAIQQQISKCQMAIATGRDISAKAGDSVFRIALDQDTHHLCTILNFYYDTALYVIQLITKQCANAAKAYDQKESYTPFSRLVKDQKVIPPYTSSGTIHESECVIGRIDDKITNKEFMAWWRNYTGLDTCHRQMNDALKKLKKLVLEIDGICIEGMTIEQQKKHKEKTETYTATIRKLVDEHNSKDDDKIAARKPGENSKLTLEETRDLAEIAESAFLMNLVLSFDGGSRNKIASKIGCRNDEESIALALLTSPDFRSNTDLLDRYIPLDYKTTPISEFNCAWWILKVYVAGIKPPSNTTVDIQNLFITGITNTLLSSPHIKPEHLLLIGCSLASIGSAAAKDKLRLIYALLIKKIEAANQLLNRVEEIDRPAVKKTLVLLNLYRSLIGLSMRDRSVAKFPVNFKHWCIDTEQSTQSITFYADDSRDTLNELLLNIRPQGGTHLVSLLKRKYHGPAVDRAVQMVGFPAASGVLPLLSPAAAKAPPPPAASAAKPPAPAAKPPAPAAKPPAPAAKPPAAIVRELEHPVPEEGEDPLVYMLEHRKQYVEMAKLGHLGPREALEYADLNRAILTLQAERDCQREAPSGGSSLRTLNALNEGRRSGQSSPPEAQQAAPPAGSMLPPPPALAPQPLSEPTPPPPEQQPRRQLTDAEQRALVAAVGFSGFYATAPSPQPAATAKNPAVQRAHSESLLGAAGAAGALPSSPSSTNIGGPKYGTSRAALPPAYAAQTPGMPNVLTLRRDTNSDVVGAGHVPATHSSSPVNPRPPSSRPPGTGNNRY